MKITALITVLSLALGVFELPSTFALNNYGDGVNQKAGHTEPTTGAGVTEAPSVKCKLQGSSRLPAFSMDGDYIIGGVFSLHNYIDKVKHNYTSMPEPLLCIGRLV